ncbi:hypothetical protein vseg_006176 [Gypsophila vaccaria]
MKRLERKWMYERLDCNKKLRSEFAFGVKELINHAKNQEEYQNCYLLRCPCAKCRNLVYLTEVDVKKHLVLKGFCPNYYDWVCHGEEYPDETNLVSENPYRDMVEDTLRDNVNHIMEDALNADVVDESPNPQVLAFFEMLKRAEQLVYEGSNMTLLQSASRLLNLKCEYNLPHKCVDGIASLIGDIIPQDHGMYRNFYETKNVLKALQLPHQKIDACPTSCMLFWKENVDLSKCTKCGDDRFYTSRNNTNGKRVPKKVLIYFPLSPRLQRLYATKHIAGEMRWHYENPRAYGIMSHPSDGEAWKHFDREYPSFASDPRNVRLGLCTDGFSPFGQFGKSYSCWPVMVTPYNLPPWLCMKKQFIFLSLIVPGPKNPKKIQIRG